MLIEDTMRTVEVGPIDEPMELDMHTGREGDRDAHATRGGIARAARGGAACGAAVGGIAEVGHWQASLIVELSQVARHARLITT